MMSMGTAGSQPLSKTVKPLQSPQVVAYAHDCQGLLESPLQAVYTLTLMAVGVLPTPLEESESSSWLLKNSSGQIISVSFWPALSVAFSFLSIIINCARAVNAIELNKKEIFKGK